MTAAELLQRVDAVLDQTIELRHALHRIPEVNYTEKKTQAHILDQLRQYKVGKVRKIAGTGLVVELAGTGPTPTVGLRADIDALPLQEATGLPWQSEHPGCMHACGHDGHTAILVGVGRVLASMKDEIPGTVRLFFQPAEEGGRGGQKMVDEGAMDEPVPRAVFALHGSPLLPVGKVGCMVGAASASTDVIEIEVTGKSTHGAYPHQGVDAIVAGAAIVTAAQTVASRIVAPYDPVVVTIGSFHGGNIDNIIAGRVDMLGTIRARDEKVRKQAFAALKRIVTQTARAHGAEATVTKQEGYPIVVNTEPEVDLIREVADTVGGRGTFATVKEQTMGGEDFSYFLQRAPGALFRLGLRDGDHTAAMHANRFDFNDKAIRLGIATMAGLALKTLGVEL